MDEVDRLDDMDDGIRGEARNAFPPPVQRLRLTFHKLGALRYLSHLDFAKILRMILRRAEVPLAYTQGFHPTPRVQFAPPLSLGMGGERELIDIMLIRRVSPEWLLGALNKIELAGCSFLAAEEIPIKEPSLEARIAASVYRVQFTNETLGITPALLQEKAQQFNQAPDWPVEIEKKNGRRAMDLKKSLSLAEVDEADANESPTPPPGPALRLAVRHAPGLFIKSHLAAGALLGLALEPGRDVRLTRVGFQMSFT